MKRLHEYSRASRFRIQRLRREANIAENADSSSSDEADAPENIENQRCRNVINPEPITSNESGSGSDGDNDGPGQEVRDDNEAQEVRRHEEEATTDDGSEASHEPGDTDDEGDEVEIEDAHHVDADHEENQLPAEEDDDFDHEEFGWNLNDDVPIYELGPITLGESMVALLSLFLRHNLSLTCLSDLIELIGMHCRAEECTFPKSLHGFKSFFSNLKFPLVRHYYCSSCSRSLPDAQRICEHCQPPTKVNFFIAISPLTQLKALFNRPGFREKLTHKATRRKIVEANYEDVYDGAVYRELSHPGRILSDPSNISLMWFTDGVSIFKSSKYELWPYYLVINELPYNDRCHLSNAILAGLWFGRNKPAVSTFLRALRPDLLRLRHGVNIRCGNPVANVFVKGIVICGTADIPAKAKFLNIKAHNSIHGCAKCKIETRQVRRGLNVYPFSDNLQLRSEEETLMHGMEAMELPRVNGVRQDIFGVKGPSLLSTFVYQYMRTTSVDVMHCVYLGVMKALLKLWFETEFSNEEFSISQHKHLVNQRLSSIRPPGFVQRITRSLDDVKYWKAHELKSFLFYYSLPVLSETLPELYIDHHKLLVYGVYLLNQRSISNDEVDLASQFLSEYVLQFEDLYGIERMSCNLHQLLHLADIVRDLGPLWVTSCFPFEDLNGKLKKLVKGTRHAELQVCSGVSMFMRLAELKHDIPQHGRPHALVKSMFDSNARIKKTPIGHRIAIVGKMKKVNDLPQMILQVLQRAGVQGRNVHEFNRFLKCSIVYGSEQYQRATMTHSSCIKYIQGEDHLIGIINRYIRVSDCDCIGNCEGCDAQYFAIVQPCQTELEFSALEGKDLPFLHTVLDRDDDHVAIQVQSIICMCFFVEIVDRNLTYVIEPVNMIEAE